MVQRGRDVLTGKVEYPALDLSTIWGDEARARGDELVFSLNAWAQPSGITIQSAYERLRDELLCDLAAALPVDVVLLMLHGAMVAQGYEDCEQDLIRRVRALVGSATVIGVELDLHCHLTPAKIDSANLVITYKEYPHVDVNDRARELFQLAIATRLGHIRPTMALFDCRMIGLYPTSREPLRGFVEEMREAERRPGVLAVSFAHGFQFADLPHVGAKMLVVTDRDPQLAKDVAREFGLKVHGLRRQIGFDALSVSLDEALSRALESSNTPVVIADQSDNPGGGAPGDATFVLRGLLDRGVNDAALAILHDPEVVKVARKAGRGARISVRLGGKTGPSSGDPVDLEATVLATLDRYMHAFPQQSGGPALFPVGDVVALRSRSVDIVVGSERCQCYSPMIFSDLGIEPRQKRVLIVKSAQHFHGAFAPMAGEVIYMAAPGAVTPDPRAIAYERFDTQRLYPWVESPLAGEEAQPACESVQSR